MSQNAREKEIFASLQRNHTENLKITAEKERQLKEAVKEFNDFMKKSLDDLKADWDDFEDAKSNIIIEFNLGKTNRIATAWSHLRNEVFAKYPVLKFFERLKEKIAEIVDIELSRATRRMGEANQTRQEVNLMYVAKTLGIINKEHELRDSEWGVDDD